MEINLQVRLIVIKMVSHEISFHSEAERTRKRSILAGNWGKGAVMSKKF